VVTHDRDRETADVTVNALSEATCSPAYAAAEAVFIEEGQFYPDLYDFVVHAVEVQGKDVVVAGLDGDSDRQPFDQMIRLVPLADRVDKLYALCAACGDGTTPAAFTQRRPGAPSDRTLVGGQETYRAVCRRHWLLGQGEANRERAQSAPAPL
jgi:thymidine kinase